MQFSCCKHCAHRSCPDSTCESLITRVTPLLNLKSLLHCAAAGVTWPFTFPLRYTMLKKRYFSTAGYKYVHVSVLTDLSRFRPVYAPKDFLEVSPVSFSTGFYSVVICMDSKQLSPCCQQLSVPVIELVVARPQC